jgi:hypothetical protein
MSSFKEQLYEVFVSGAIVKGWSGPECIAYVPVVTHAIEDTAWMVIAFVVYKRFKFRETWDTMRKSIDGDLMASSKKGEGSHPLGRAFEVVVAMIYFVLFAGIVYNKIMSNTLSYIVQPCHLVMVAQGVALLSKNSWGVMLSMCMLPFLTGTLLAMLVPDTDGMDMPFEKEIYWLEHYLIQSMPVYLLCRSNFIGLKYVGPFTVVVGIWLLIVMHFGFYEAIDLATGANVEFVMCPTDGMQEIFRTQIHPYLLWPSYRTTMSWFVAVFAAVLAPLYIYTCKLLRVVFGARESEKSE